MLLKARAPVATNTDADIGCSWYGCDHDDDAVLIDPATGDWWCLVHLGDELLPKLTQGGLDGCTYCGKSARWHTDDGRTYHPECARQAMKRPPKATKRHGAYGRRADGS